MAQIQEGSKVIVRGSHSSAMCGQLLESIVDRHGVVMGAYEDFYWVLIDGEKYLLSSNDLEVL